MRSPVRLHFSLQHLRGAEAFGEVVHLDPVRGDLDRGIGSDLRVEDGQRLADALPAVDPVVRDESGSSLQHRDERPLDLATDVLGVLERVLVAAVDGVHETSDVSRLRFREDLAVLHHERHVLDRGDVARRIARHGDDIRE